MSNKVGIWIDHEKAVIVATSGEGVATRTVQSDVAGHPRFGGGPDGGGEQKYEARHAQDLDRYYDKVIGLLEQPEAILILGPGEAKLQLKERLGRSRSPSPPKIEVEAADRLTESQLVARFKTHFGVER